MRYPLSSAGISIFHLKLAILVVLGNKDANGILMDHFDL